MKNLEQQFQVIRLKYLDNEVKLDDNCDEIRNQLNKIVVKAIKSTKSDLIDDAIDYYEENEESFDINYMIDILKLTKTLTIYIDYVIYDYVCEDEVILFNNIDLIKNMRTEHLGY